MKTIKIAKNLRLDKRKGSNCWQARITLPNGKRIIKSTKTTVLEDAEDIAREFRYEIKARIDNGLPVNTKKFKDVANFLIETLNAELDGKAGKKAYKDYISALEKWLIPYFGKTNIDKISYNSLENFDLWRTKNNGNQKFSKSGINNHNAALGKVFDTAEKHGWMLGTLRPKLLNNGVKSKSRGSFTIDEYIQIYTELRTWHQKTDNKSTRATRKTLRNYVLFLANTGVRHGTEALNLKWKNIARHQSKGQTYLALSVDGKTGTRSLIARDRVEGYLDRQRKLNPVTSVGDFDHLLASKSEAFVFTTETGNVAKLRNLMRSFDALLDELGLRIGADGKTRTLYSLRHFYATQDLTRGVSAANLASQLGTSIKMIEKYYSKYSPLLNADTHSGRSYYAEKKTKLE
ncbi:site-specific recombinase phage integrase family protein [Amylibacter ulvae]|uniref:Site-specific recombinase phage integrase family protein n=1 Tax=Paramylibacter ulvae TaxID=1651968 RepID=A0ABQ3DB66_9RHOB|nr:site-specific integrase [Amylibacter ulvae]GHA60317.1 site-specific recombinase phage integrase family protein [Amylibacter ulvae]